MANKARKNKSKAPKVFTGKFGRPLVVLCAITIFVAGWLLIPRLAGDEVVSAKQVADETMKAIANCDVTTLQKNYVLLTDEKLAKFKQNCKKGEKITYQQDSTKPSKNRSNASGSEYVNYSVVQEGKTYKVIMALVWDGDTKTWRVFLLSGFRTDLFR